MRNIYEEDKYNYKEKILEGIILGRRGGKVFVISGLCLLIGIIVDLFTIKENYVAAVVIAMLYVLVLLRAYVKACRMSEKYMLEKAIHTLSMSENVISQVVRNENNEVISSKVFEKKDYMYTCKGIKYIFVYFSNNEVCILKKNGFIEGTEEGFIAELKKNNNVRNTQFCDRAPESWKVCVITGIVLGILFTVSLIEFVGIDTSPSFLCVRMIIVCILFTLWLRYAFVCYLRWFSRQKIIMKILSIVFYPFSFFVFMFLGLIELLLSLIRIIKTSDRHKN